MFITFEGPEGCGKSTHAKKLKTFLEGKGFQVLLTQEPGGTQVGKHIRGLLLDPQNVLDEKTEIYLFAADRTEHVSKVIKPALASGKIVVSDRYTDSTLAYQIGGRNLPEDLVEYIVNASSKDLKPDLTILLDVSPEIGIKRATQASAPDRFEKEKLEFHENVRKKYLEIAEKNHSRVKTINTDKKGIEEIQSEIRQIVEKKFRKQ
ncbi:MAG: dTMP kinase [Candidatus Margulisbacteria bacterium]|nr:dTMP kinase [Candidatus Margulisiibacteriota bacterium]